MDEHSEQPTNSDQFFIDDAEDRPIERTAAPKERAIHKKIIVSPTLRIIGAAILLIVLIAVVSIATLLKPHGINTYPSLLTPGIYSNLELMPPEGLSGNPESLRSDLISVRQPEMDTIFVFIRYVEYYRVADATAETIWKIGDKEVSCQEFCAYVKSHPDVQKKIKAIIVGGWSSSSAAMIGCESV